MESKKTSNDFFSKNENEIETIIREYWITIDSYIINNDGSIDVGGDVIFAKNMGFITELPLKFNKVSGNFDCSQLSLTTLKNSPIEVGNFDCSFNQLLSLEHAPKKVIGTFIFDNTTKSLYTGEKSCDFKKVELFFRTNDPKLVGLPDIISKNAIYLPIILKYQKYYEIWNHDKSLNEANFDGLIEDIQDGLE